MRLRQPQLWAAAQAGWLAGMWGYAGRPAQTPRPCAAQDSRNGKFLPWHHPEQHLSE